MHFQKIMLLIKPVETTIYPEFNDENKSVIGQMVEPAKNKGMDFDWIEE